MQKRGGIGATAAAIAIACTAHTAAGQLIGSLGDGLTDEYFEDGFGYAYNWPMHLVLSRGLDFGPTAAQASQPGGTWGEPRRSGYRFNWARGGASSASLLSQGQHTGLAAQAAAHGVSHAVVWIGANDFHFGPGGPYAAIYNESWTMQQIDDHIQATVSNIDQTIQTLKASGLNIVVLNVPDYGVTPAVTALYPDQQGRQRVTAAIQSLNQQLQGVAKEHEVMLVDVFSMMQAMFGTHAVSFDRLLLGNVEIDIRKADTVNNTRPDAGFVHDGLYPHTTIQGVFANLVITALNMGYDTGIAPLAEEEILTRAGLAYGGQDTLDTQIGFYDDYIYNFGCYANCSRTTTSPILSVDDFMCFIDKYSYHDPQADCDGNGGLNINDFLCFIDKFAAGCK